jgi:spermidine synthase
MGCLNLFAGAAFFALRSLQPGANPEDDPQQDRTLTAPAIDPTRAARMPGAGALALVALLAGFAMMTLQTTANRVGALSLGASPFTFSMVVAMFVLGIALGSLTISRLRRIPRSALPLSQWSLVACLLVLEPWVQDAPYWAHRLRLGFGVSDADFLPFHAAVFAATFAVLALPLALSGAMLPLLFHTLREQAESLGRVAGALYAWNTLGSLLGALLGGYLLFFWFDLEHLYRLTVVALALAATLLSVRFVPRARRASGLALAGTALLCLVLPQWPTDKLSAGLFRVRTALPASHSGADALAEVKRSGLGSDFVLFYDDDPTGSIAVHRLSQGSLAIVSNGKVDGNIPRDSTTQALIGLLPA